MNSVHDMGGMDGFGAIDAEIDEPVFHAPWEGRMFAMNVAMGSWGKWNIDAGRHARERMDPVAYLDSSYYERFLAGLETLCIEHGMLTRDEIDARVRDLMAADEEGA